MRSSGTPRDPSTDGAPGHHREHPLDAGELLSTLAVFAALAWVYADVVDPRPFVDPALAFARAVSSVAVP